VSAGQLGGEQDVHEIPTESSQAGHRAGDGVEGADRVQQLPSDVEDGGDALNRAGRLGQRPVELGLEN
jgi:hypothetical protein